MYIKEYLLQQYALKQAHHQSFEGKISPNILAITLIGTFQSNMLILAQDVDQTIYLSEFSSKDDDLHQRPQV